MERAANSASRWIVACVVLLAAPFARAGAADGKLDVYFIDVEGGASTLMVTPAGQSVLIDTGNLGDRDPGRIMAAAKTAGIADIDILIVTHYHTDHYGGSIGLSKMMPIHTQYDNADQNPSREKAPPEYLAIKVDKHIMINPGDELPLKQGPGAKLTIRCLAARKRFVEPGANAKENPFIADAKGKSMDLSDNANSVVTLLSFGDFRFFDPGDLTWNIEHDLVSPLNRVGTVDVFQVTHHGLALSNNPVMVKAIEPTVAIMNNGTTKGCEPETFATLKATSSIQAIFQLHKNLRPDGDVNNTSPEYIANIPRECDGNYVKMSVAPDGSSYTVGIPATKFENHIKPGSMSKAMVEWLAQWVYLLLGPAVWAIFAFGMVKGRKRMQILVRPAPPIPQPPPKVSILIPAKDEAQQIERCVRSVLGLDYPNFDCIVIDDRSTDNTGRILDTMAAADSRLIIIHLKEGSLPAGWGGKSFALHNGLERADGEWLLFVDADVQLEPDVLSATIAWATKRQFDLISMLPTFVSGSASEAILQPLAGAATAAMFMINLTNSPQWKTAFANGQYLCVRRDRYEAVGGHAAIRGTLSEDVAIARKLKSAGYRPRISNGDSWGTVRMYEGFGAIFRGWSRNFYVGSLGRPWRILGLIVFLILCCYSVIPAAGWAIYRQIHPSGALRDWCWLLIPAAHYLAMSGAMALVYFWSGERWWYGFFLPISALVLLAICVKALWICLTGKVEWRGTQYLRHELSADPQG